MMACFPLEFSEEKGNPKSLIVLLYESQLSYLQSLLIEQFRLDYTTFIPGSIRAPAVVTIYKTNSNPKFFIPYVQIQEH